MSKIMSTVRAILLCALINTEYDELQILASTYYYPYPLINMSRGTCMCLVYNVQIQLYQPCRIRAVYYIKGLFPAPFLKRFVHVTKYMTQDRVFFSLHV